MQIFLNSSDMVLKSYGDRTQIGVCLYIQICWKLDKASSELWDPRRLQNLIRPTRQSPKAVFDRHQSRIKTPNGIAVCFFAQKYQSVPRNFRGQILKFKVSQSSCRSGSEWGEVLRLHLVPTILYAWIENIRNPGWGRVPLGLFSRDLHMLCGSRVWSHFARLICHTIVHYFGQDTPTWVLDFNSVNWQQ